MSVRTKLETWSIEIPEGWTLRADDLGVDIIPEDPALGAIQVSEMSKPFETVTHADIADFAADHLDMADAQRDAEIGPFRGIELSYKDGGSYWRIWYLRADRTMLAVSYSCAEGDEAKTRAMLEAMVGTLQLEGAPAE